MDQHRKKNRSHHGLSTTSITRHRQNPNPRPQNNGPRSGTVDSKHTRGSMPSPPATYLSETTKLNFTNCTLSPDMRHHTLLPYHLNAPSCIIRANGQRIL